MLLSAAAPAAPLRDDGFIALLFGQGQRWLHGLVAQAREVGGALAGLAGALDPAVSPRAGWLLARATLALSGMFAAGLLLEWLVRRLLATPRRRWLACARSGGAAVAAGATPAGHVGRLRALVFALGLLLLDLLPLAAFLPAAAWALAGLAGGRAPVQLPATTLAAIYVAVRALQVVLQRLLDTDPALGVLRVDAGPAGIVQAWLRWIVAIVAVGVVVGDMLPLLGAAAAHGAMLKLAMSLACLAAVALLVRLWVSIERSAGWTAGPDGLAAALRGRLAAWTAPLACLLVAGLWSVLILGLREGLPRLTRIVVLTAAILLGARVLATLSLGAMARLLCGGPAAAGPGRGGRYYPWLRWLVTVAVGAVALVLLLQAWGADAAGWLFHSTVGRGLLRILATLLVAAAAAVAVWEAVVRGIEGRIAHWTGQGDRLRASRLSTLLPMIRTALFAVLALTIGLTALSEAGVNTASLIASAGVVGIAVGFGSQKLVQDFITGVFLLLENAMQVGDTVTLASVSGVVEELSVRTVRLRGGDGSLYIVPFSAVTTVNNANRGLGNASVSVDIAADADVDAAMDALRGIGRDMRQDDAYAGAILGDIEIWGVNAIDGAHINILGQIRCTDAGRWGVQREINRRIVARFRERGIALADPHRRAVRLSPPAAERAA